MSDATSLRQPRWKRFVSHIVVVAFCLTCLSLAWGLYIVGSTWGGGSPTATATQTDVMVRGGRKRFVTRDEKDFTDHAARLMMFPVPSFIALYLFAKFVLRVQLPFRYN